MGATGESTCAGDASRLPPHRVDQRLPAGSLCQRTRVPRPGQGWSVGQIDTEAPSRFPQVRHHVWRKTRFSTAPAPRRGDRVARNVSAAILVGVVVQPTLPWPKELVLVARQISHGATSEMGDHVGHPRRFGGLLLAGHGVVFRRPARLTPGCMARGPANQKAPSTMRTWVGRRESSRTRRSTRQRIHKNGGDWC